MDSQDPLVNRILRMMATQAMSQAVYFSTGALPQDQYYHYGTTSSPHPLDRSEVHVSMSDTRSVS